jgi:hypothetical protein
MLTKIDNNTIRYIFIFVLLLIFVLLKICWLIFTFFHLPVGLAGSIVINAKIPENGRFLLKFFLQIGIIYVNSFTCGG